MILYGLQYSLADDAIQLFVYISLLEATPSSLNKIQGNLILTMLINYLEKSL